MMLGYRLSVSAWMAATVVVGFDADSSTPDQDRTEAQAGIDTFLVEK